MPVATQLQRTASMLCFVLVIGQCAFLGLFGATLRKILYRRSIELKDAYKRIEELAELDELTGSFNRRCIMQMLDDEIARAHRSQTPCSIALIDLDWFKRINDAYGHPTGDEVLAPSRSPCSPTSATSTGSAATGARNSCWCFPIRSVTARRSILDRLRAIIAGLDWSAFSPDMRVTISAGVATLRPDETEDIVSCPRRQRALRSQGTRTQPYRQRLIRSHSFPATENRRRDRTLQDRAMSSNPQSSESLLDELQTTLAHGTVARRVETLRRVTDLFLSGAVDYSDEQFELFDDVFQCLMEHIETSAKALLASRLAPIDDRAAADHPHAGVRRCHRGRRPRCCRSRSGSTTKR